ncbi:ATP-binding protein [Klebsiella variicola]|uniref:ATP-binding protein n=1 Tax=Klebsiella variicola TaxID=244366 RepID=UPI0007CC1FD4|nr:Divergent AAA domain [Klebsiella variicola]
MNETIEKLIASGKEGPWWDFKQTYHQNNAALVHDILCMANVLHDGDRYLIFGVNDEGLVTGVPEDGKQLNQANLIDLLRKVSFALVKGIGVASKASVRFNASEPFSCRNSRSS